MKSMTLATILLTTRLPSTATSSDSSNTAARRTFGDDRYARVEDGELRVTSLLNWYKSDFVSDEYSPSAETVPEYAAIFGDEQIRAFVRESADPSYSYLDYDWSLNDTHQ
ncbi:MAG: hypothetical protein ACQEVA_20950 [Myxococcota bacterium]